MDKKIAGQRAQIESQQKEINNQPQRKDLRMLREAEKIQESQEAAATTIASDSESAEYWTI